MNILHLSWEKISRRNKEIEESEGKYILSREQIRQNEKLIHFAFFLLISLGISDSGGF